MFLTLPLFLIPLFPIVPLFKQYPLHKGTPLLISPDCVVKTVCRVLKNSKLECGISVTLYVVFGRRLISLAELELPGRVIFWKEPGAMLWSVPLLPGSISCCPE